MRPFFGYYGGKWRDAVKLYPKPRCDLIVEPFAGSAGFALRYAERNVVLCELNPIVASVWEYLIEVKPEEIRAIPNVRANGSVDDLKGIACRRGSWATGNRDARNARGDRSSPRLLSRLQASEGPREEDAVSRTRTC